MSLDDLGPEEWQKIGQHLGDGLATSRIGAVPLGAGIPCAVAAVERNDLFPAIAMAVAGEECLVLTPTGHIYWTPTAYVTLKYPPDGPHRLLFGWAEKGPDGRGRT